MNKEEKLKFKKRHERFDFNNKNDPNILNNECCDNLISTLVKVGSKFKSESQDNCCDKTLESLLYFFLKKTTEKNYIVAKNAMFGDLVEIRTLGFERRHLHNVKILKTYKEAYHKTEEEYQNNFGKIRCFSYDTFRQAGKKGKYIKIDNFFLYICRSHFREKQVKTKNKYYARKI